MQAIKRYVNQRGMGISGTSPQPEDMQPRKRVGTSSSSQPRHDGLSNIHEAQGIVLQTPLVRQAQVISQGFRQSVDLELRGGSASRLVANVEMD
jgi:hypothetical protein